jgi:hypothetical protein
MNPSTGSIVVRSRGPISAGLPTYVSVPKPQAFAGAAYLGAACNPFTTDVEPNAEDFAVRDLKVPSGMTVVRVERRQKLLQGLDKLRRSIDASGQIAGMDAFYQQALALVTSENATSPGGQRQEYANPSQRKAESWSLRGRLWVQPLVLRRVRHRDARAIEDEHGSTVPLPWIGNAHLELLCSSRCQRGENAGGNATPCIAVAGRIWRANSLAIGGTVRNDSRQGISATMVVVEHLAQKAPDGRDWTEHSVPKLDAMVVQNFEDAGLG